MEPEQVREIMRRLEPVLVAQGLRVEVVGQEDGVIRLRARRVGPGATLAFMVRALEGTFRRYLPDFREVVVDAYEGPPEPGSGPPKPPVAGPAFQGLPGLDLAGSGRSEAARALEAFAGMAQRRGETRFRLCGLVEADPRRAALKWLSLGGEGRSAHPEAGTPGTWIVHLAGPCTNPETCGPGEAGDVIPARVLVIPQD